MKKGERANNTSIRRKTSTLSWKNFLDVTFSALAVEPSLSEEYQHRPEKAPSSTTGVDVMSDCRDTMITGSSTLGLDTDSETAINKLNESVSLTRLGEEKVYSCWVSRAR